MDEFEARFESLRAQFKDYGSLYDENFEGRFTREDCREVLAMVDNLPANDVASKLGFKARGWYRVENVERRLWLKFGADTGQKCPPTRWPW
ncbi:tRNA modification GTPase MnmE-like protein [Corchorus olitorius]|uniref:tRNA modification GTPase MnmE-like protein n=1 Tax=Corchorus olitorius TaxID=93759 RepID=A0A1R3KN19_9ROSI|nr:tRNA modification GTPase MnmE-like protein [Corchorus olitorius]